MRVGSLEAEQLSGCSSLPGAHVRSRGLPQPQKGDQNPQPPAGVFGARVPAGAGGRARRGGEVVREGITRTLMHWQLSWLIASEKRTRTEKSVTRYTLRTHMRMRKRAGNMKNATWLWPRPRGRSVPSLSTTAMGPSPRWSAEVLRLKLKHVVLSSPAGTSCPCQI